MEQEIKEVTSNLSKELHWNVIEEEDFKSISRKVFSKVANSLVKTLGPFGATTIIEKLGEMHVTKDGWSVLQKIHFDNNTYNSIMQLLVGIAAPVVIRVGDGSTTSIKSADSVLQRLESSEAFKDMRPKDVIDLLEQVVQDIIKEILDNAVPINKDDKTYQDIYNLALISTNNDKKVAELIRQIYVETGNPTIQYNSSKTNKTYIEIVTGYKGKITYMDGIYANSDDGSCNINNPLIITFDHVVQKETDYDLIIMDATQRALQQNKQLVVIAPGYDNFTLKNIKAVANGEYRAMGKTTQVYCRVSAIDNISQEEYNDFAIMAGSTMINESHSDTLFAARQEPDKYKDVELITSTDYLGGCEKITIGTSDTTIQGLNKRNENMYEAALRDARQKFNDTEQKHRELGIVSTDLYKIKQRLSKLNGSMGIIYVGGYSSLQKKGNRDLVEDAVRACESAFNYGYNIGGSLIIPISVKKIKERAAKESIIMKKTYVDALDLISEAFQDVFECVLKNKFKKEDDIFIGKIIRACVEDEVCYNLDTDQYTTDVINSCYTDIEILKAAVSIVSLLVSSNQYVSILVPENETSL